MEILRCKPVLEIHLYVYIHTSHLPHPMFMLRSVTHERVRSALRPTAGVRSSSRPVRSSSRRTRSPKFELTQIKKREKHLTIGGGGLTNAPTFAKHSIYPKRMNIARAEYLTASSAPIADPARATTSAHAAAHLIRIPRSHIQFTWIQNH